MTGGGEGPSVVEVATSLPARLLGAIRRTEEVFEFPNEEERRRRDLEFSENSKKSGSSLST